MAYFEAKEVVTVNASADLSTKQYHAVALNTSGLAVVSNATGLVIGTLDNAPKAAGQPAAVAFKGVVKGVAAATFDAGSGVTVNANGQFVVATTGTRIYGIALESGVANKVISILWQPIGRVA